MEAVSHIISNTIPLRPAVSRAEEPAEIQQPVKSVQASPKEPVKDQFIPEKKQEPIGLYRLGKDTDGTPKIYFDDPKQPAKSLENSSFDDDLSADGVKPKDQKKESCTCNTDTVDREIDKLKRKQQDLTRQLQSETDETKRRILEKRLAQVDRELGQKDNDTYRKQHAVYTMA